MHKRLLMKKKCNNMDGCAKDHSPNKLHRSLCANRIPTVTDQRM